VCVCVCVNMAYHQRGSIDECP